MDYSLQYSAIMVPYDLANVSSPKVTVFPPTVNACYFAVHNTCFHAAREMLIVSSIIYL
jgi:hypothetical protein